jgi:hypothetical protein
MAHRCRLSLEYWCSCTAGIRWSAVWHLVCHRVRHAVSVCVTSYRCRCASHCVRPYPHRRPSNCQVSRSRSIQSIAGTVVLVAWILLATRSREPRSRGCARRNDARNSPLLPPMSSSHSPASSSPCASQAEVGSRRVALRSTRTLNGLLNSNQLDCVINSIVGHVSIFLVLLELAYQRIHVSLLFWPKL